MRIGLDARTIFRAQRRGTGKNLIDLYRQVIALRPDWEVVAYHRDCASNDALPGVQNRRIEMPGDRWHAWERYRLPLAAWRDGVDLLHCPANGCPDWMPTPTLVTIHDLIPLDAPASRGKGLATPRVGTSAHFARGIARACAAAAGIICPSRYTRDRLVSQCGADPGRIHVIPWAPDSAMQVVEEYTCQAVLQRYGVRDRFVLHLGANDPRKNTRRVINAWAAIKPAQRRGWQLLIIGLEGQVVADLRQQAVQLNLGDSVILHGFADEADMPALFSSADVLAFPSLSEGFGLPILDAWVDGTAVLTSSTTSLPEVAGDAAILVDPSDTIAITRGLSWLLRDSSLRRQLVDLGRQRVAQYTWQRTVSLFVEAAEAAAQRQRARIQSRAA
ncbi:MAG: glycosyltransferase family 1 protein [Phycisphaeraceae bacterium]